MNKNILLIVFAFCFSTHVLAQANIQLTSACDPFYGQGTYEYQGLNQGKPYYRLASNPSGGDCSSLGNRLACEREALYFIKWETDRWYWIREPFQCQWEAAFGECVPNDDLNYFDQDGPFTYMYSNTATTPEPPSNGWTVLPTAPSGYCEPTFTTLSTVSFLDTKFKVYPNPVSKDGLLNIDLGEPFTNVKTALYSILGQQLLVEKEHKSVLQIKFRIDQSKGIYFLKIKVENDVVIKRIVLE